MEQIRGGIKQNKTMTAESVRIAHNSLFNMLGRLAAYLVQFLLTPYVIGHIGIDAYGVWALVLTLSGYVGLLDLGISAAAMKYYAKYRATESREAINALVTTGLVFYASLGFVFILIAVALGHWLLGFFHIATGYRLEVETVIVIAVAAIALQYIFGVFRSVILGAQRMDLYNYVLVAVALLGVLGTIFVLQAGFGLLGLVLNNLVTTAITGVCTAIIAFRLDRAIRVGFRFLRRSVFRDLIGYGGILQLTSIAAQLDFSADRVLLGLLLGSAAIGYYDIGSRVTYMLIIMSWMATMALIPATSAMHARTGDQFIQTLYLQATRYHLVFTLLLGTSLFVISAPFVTGWLGVDYDGAIQAMQALAVAYTALALTHPAMMTLRGVARLKNELVFALIRIIGHVALSYFAIRALGFRGILFSVPVSLMLSSAGFVLVASHTLGMDNKRILRLYGIPIIVAFGWGTVVFFTLGQLMTHSTSMSRIAYLATAVGAGVLVAGGFLALLWLLRYLDVADLKTLQHVLVGRKRSKAKAY
jgi:O-antigen/teichoic acid export membrane protein